MSACSKCAKPIENEAFSGILCQSCFAEEERKNSVSEGGLLSKIPLALIVGLLPFFISFRTSSSSSISMNGVEVGHSTQTIDYVAVALGPLAILLGLIAVIKANKGPAATRTRGMVLAVVGILLGAFQIYRGLH